MVAGKPVQTSAVCLKLRTAHDDNSSSDPTDEDSEQSNQGRGWIDQPNEISGEDANKGDIIISEIFPILQAPTCKIEFLELENVSEKIINITDWKLTNKNKGEFIIPSFTLNPGSIVVF
jgi:hypothetical protein